MEKLSIGTKVMGKSLSKGSVFEVVGFSYIDDNFWYALKSPDDSYIVVRKHEDLFLVPDPKLEAAKKVIEKYDQYLTASNEYEVARTAFVKLTGKAMQPIYNAGRLVQQADSQKEN